MLLVISVRTTAREFAGPEQERILRCGFCHTLSLVADGRAGLSDSEFAPVSEGGILSVRHRLLSVAETLVYLRYVLLTYI